MSFDPSFFQNTVQLFIEKPVLVLSKRKALKNLRLVLEFVYLLSYLIVVQTVGDGARYAGGAAPLLAA